MSLSLYYSPTSPFVRKVMVTLIETDQRADVTLVPAHTTPMAPDAALLSANPMGKVPALVREDGPAIYDSRVICRYLDARAAAALYPEPRIWEVLTLEAHGDAVLEAALLMVYEGRLRPVDQQSPDWVEAQWRKVSAGLAALEARWMSHLNGPHDAGHIAIGCALAYVDFRHDERVWRADCPALATWFSTYAERPAMRETQPPA